MQKTQQKQNNKKRKAAYFIIEWRTYSRAPLRTYSRAPLRTYPRAPLKELGECSMQQPKLNRHFEMSHSMWLYTCKCLFSPESGMCFQVKTILRARSLSLYQDLEDTGLEVLQAKIFDHSLEHG